MSGSLNANAGDIQHALAGARVFGNSASDIERCQTVRSKLFEKIDLPPAERGQRGQIGKLKTAGRNGELVILKYYGRPSKVITHDSFDAMVADFEYESPRTPLPLFIPMRLYLPYGIWEEKDGARILLSRDYCPLWRIRDSSSPERMNPWEWIKFKSQSWFWEDGNTPWNNKNTYSTCIKVLEDNGIRSMPLLAEVLPLVVLRDDVSGFKSAVQVLKTNRLR